MNISDRKVVQVFKSIAEVQLGLKPGEHVLIVTDPAEDPRVLEALNWSISKTGAIPTLMIQPNVGWDPSDVYALTDPVKKAYMGADVVISATFSSNSACYGRPQEFREVIDRGEKYRLFFLGLRTMEEILDDANTDYLQVKAIHDWLLEAMLGATTLQIITDNGTDFTCDLQGVDPVKIKNATIQHGFVNKPGQMSGRPEGDFHVPPRPESMNGRLVIDGPIANISDTPDQPVEITVEQGRIIKIEGGETAKALDDYLSSFDIDQHYISELGLGTNWSMRDKGKTENGAKRGHGNFHVAYGGWWGFQDDIPYRVHGDMIMKWTEGSTFFADGKVLFENGEFKVDITH
jgi:hypothetical protein